MTRFISNVIFGLIVGITIAIVVDGVRAQTPAFVVKPVWQPLADIMPRDPFLPPKEWDHEYRGTAEIRITRTDVAGVQKACSRLKVLPGSVTLGCSRVSSTLCDVYIVHDELLVIYKKTYDVVWRHERAHCSGWTHAEEYK